MPKFRYDSSEEELFCLKHGLQSQTLRCSAIQRLSNMVRSNKVDEQNHGFELLTYSFILKNPGKKHDLRKDKRVYEELGWSLHSRSHYIDIVLGNGEPSIKNGYLSKVEDIIDNVSHTYIGDEKTDKLLVFSECFREMANVYSSKKCQDYFGDNIDLAFAGTSLVVSEKIGFHDHSILMLPSNASDAVCCLHGDQPRILFEQYGGEESGESVILNMYGTDGKYAQFYRNLLKCNKRYPSQKCL